MKHERRRGKSFEVARSVFRARTSDTQNDAAASRKVVVDKINYCHVPVEVITVIVARFRGNKICGGIVHKFESRREGLWTMSSVDTYLSYTTMQIKQLIVGTLLSHVATICFS